MLNFLLFVYLFIYMLGGGGGGGVKDTQAAPRNGNEDDPAT